MSIGYRLSVIDVSEKLASPLQGMSKKSNLYGRNGTVKTKSGLATRHKRNYRITVWTFWIQAGFCIFTAWGRVLVFML